MKTTKEIILEEALNLFSIHGYDGVSVQDIAQAVGIKAPSLYKHYSSKQDIFDSIINMGYERYKAQATMLEIDGIEPERDQSFYQNIEVEQLVQLGIQLFQYFLHDEFMSKIRKVLTIDQYRNKDSSSLLIKQYIDDPLDYQSQLFKFIEQDEKSTLDYQVMALHFYSPIHLMLVLSDANPQREAEAISYVKKHIIQFHKLYKG